MSENSSQDERISSMALQRKAYDDFLKWKSAPDRRAPPRDRRAAGGENVSHP